MFLNAFYHALDNPLPKALFATTLFIFHHFSYLMLLQEPNSTLLLAGLLFIYYVTAPAIPLLFIIHAFVLGNGLAFNRPTWPSWPALALVWLIFNLIYLAIHYLAGYELGHHWWWLWILKPSHPQLWYLQQLILIALIAPMLVPWLARLDRDQFHYLLMIWLIFSLLLPTLQREWNVRFSYQFPVMAFLPLFPLHYFGYLLVGFYCYYHRRTKLISKSLSFLIYMLITLLLILYHGANDLSNTDLFSTDLSLLVAMQTFTLFLSLPQDNKIPIAKFTYLFGGGNLLLFLLYPAWLMPLMNYLQLSRLYQLFLVLPIILLLTLFSLIMINFLERILRRYVSS